MNRRRVAATAWLVIVAVLLGGLFVQVRSGFSLETDVMKLFPSTSDRRVLRVVTKMMEDKTAGKVLFVLSADGRKPSDSARKAFVKTLKSSPLVTTVISPGDDQTRRAYYDFYFPHRYQLFSPGVKEALNSSSPVRSLVTGVRRLLYGSTGPLVSKLLPEDPLLLFPRLMTHWQKSLGRTSGTDGSTGQRIVAQLDGDPYSVGVQRKFYDLLESLHSNETLENNNVTFEWTGVIRFARTIRKRMRRDLRTISVLSTTAVVLLIVLVFWSLRHLFVLVGTLIVSILSAMTVLYWIWPRPHIFTIVFSTSLIGVSVDYTFHYFTERHYSGTDTSGRSTLRAIFPGITIGMITTLIGYAGLTLTPLPILKQMAVFSSVGILVAFGTVVCWYPYCFRSSPESDRIRGFDTLARWLLEGWRWLLSSRRLIGAAALVVLVLLAAGLSQLSFNDSVRYFENVPEGLVENDRRIRRQTGQWNTGRFILVEAPDRQTLLRRLESLKPVLDRFVRQGTVGDYRSLIPFLPSKKRQRNNFGDLKRTLLQHRQRFRSEMLELGVPRTSLAGLFGDLRQPPGTFITPREWLESRVSFGLRTLWLGRTQDRYNTIVLLRNIRSEGALRSNLGDVPGVYYRNRLRSFNRLFKSYRREAMLVTGLAYLVIILLLVFRYGLAGGAITATPSIAGGLITLAVLSLFGWAFNVTHVLALLLVLGIGIDYAVFLREGLNHGREVRGTMVAILLSAFSTIFSFGFLGFSRAKMLTSIGVTVFVGIFVVLLLAPFVQWGVSRDGPV